MTNHYEKYQKNTVVVHIPYKVMDPYELLPWYTWYDGSYTTILWYNMNYYHNMVVVHITILLLWHPIITTW